MSILVTGFEPFGGSSRNASWEAVSLLPETIAGHAVYRMRLPVCYGQAGDLLVEMMRRIRPTVTLCCGVAGGRKAITPELIAVNYRRAAIADNADVLYAGEKIDPKRPDAHMTRLNVLRMVDAMKSAGLPADLSLTAGAYVCNDLYFALLDRGLTVGGELAVKVENAAGTKCPRCWKHSLTPNAEGLCPRCAEVVRHLPDLL